jgi:hypothetical protein
MDRSCARHGASGPVVGPWNSDPWRAACEERKTLSTLPRGLPRRWFARRCNPFLR